MADVVLIGLPGAGKTTAGQALARHTGRLFTDTDDIFFEREHVSVQEFLRTHDEATFRSRELEALRQALSAGEIVATGGGVVSTSAARELLASELTVWLECPQDVLVSRVAQGDRPLLGDDPAARLVELRVRRDDLYAEVSRFRVDASQPVEDVVDEILHIVRSAPASS